MSISNKQEPVNSSIGSNITARKTVWIIRHGEKPDNPKDHEYDGLTRQGGIRAFYLQEFIESELKLSNYATFTYTKAHSDGLARSRAYYTLQFLSPSEKHTYDTRDQISQLVTDIRQCNFPNMLICWEHVGIMELLTKLTGKNFDASDFNRYIDWFSSQIEICFRKLHFGRSGFGKRHPH